MTAINNIKSMLTISATKDDNEDWPEGEKKGGLKNAIEAANKRIEVSEKIEAEALMATEIEETLAVEMAKEIKTEFDLDSFAVNSTDSDTKPNTVNLDGKVISPMESKTSVGKKISERVLELQRKQDSIIQMRDSIQEGATILETLAKKSEQLTDYLAKAELELDTLETTEAKYARLHTASEALAREHREVKQKLEEKYKQVQLLEGQKHKNRDMLDKAQLEINRLIEQGKSQASDMDTQAVVLAKLKDKNLDLSEQNKTLTQGNIELTNQNRELQTKFSEISEAHTEVQKALSKNEFKVETLSKENEETSVELLDIQARYTSLNDKYADMVSKLEEAKYELDAERSSFDEKLRLKDARILKLDKNIELLTRQVSLTEDMVADLSQEKAIKQSKLVLEKSNARNKKTTTSEQSKEHLENDNIAIAS